MKKFLILLITAALLLTMGGTALAAGLSDIAGLSSAAQTSITRLSDLDVINGYPDGKFRPEGTITRAEFAKIAVIIGGLANSANRQQNTATPFPDVKTSEWYTGWINIAADQGYVQGFPDGSFQPNAEISYAQVLTVLLRVLGYDEKLPGDWPADYITKARTLNITKEVSFTNTGAAPRIDVALMTSAALDCNLVKWDAVSQSFVNKNTPAVTLFDTNFAPSADAGETTVRVTRATYAAILDTFRRDGKDWVDVYFIGQKRQYEVDSDLGLAKGNLYTYYLSSNKLTARALVFDPDVFQDGVSSTHAKDDPGSIANQTYAQVTDVDTEHDTLAINGSWYAIDDRTEIYDYSDWYDDGSDPVYYDEFGSINKDDYIVYVDNGDDERIARLLIIVNNIQ